MTPAKQIEFPIETRLDFESIRHAVHALQGLPGVVFAEYYPQHHRVVIEFHENIVSLKRIYRVLWAKGITPIVGLLQRLLHELKGPAAIPAGPPAKPTTRDAGDHVVEDVA